MKDGLEEVKKEIKEMKQSFEQKIKTYAYALSASLPNTDEREVDKTIEGSRGKPVMSHFYHFQEKEKLNLKTYVEFGVVSYIA